MEAQEKTAYKPRTGIMSAWIIGPILGLITQTIPEDWDQAKGFMVIAAIVVISLILLMVV